MGVTHPKAFLRREPNRTVWEPGIGETVSRGPANHRNQHAELEIDLLETHCGAASVASGLLEGPVSESGSLCHEVGATRE